MNRFLLNDCLIDPSRNTFVIEGKIVDIQPKAMEVLLVLKNNIGQVVSHDQLMDEVWSNTVVNANTLQRCITQLRQALGDNGKQQRVIQTHAKKGYCLLAEINQATNVQQPPSKKLDKRKTFYIAICFSIISLIIVFILLADSAKLNKNVSFINPKPLTASDIQEHFGSYSPDGKFILFQRKSDIYSCSAMLWAKNIKTGKETQLLKNAERLGSVSWSNDSNQIVFTSQTHCMDPKPTQEKCWKLNTLDFSLALQGEALPITQLGCYEQPIAHARWLTDNSIAILESNQDSQQLVSFNLLTKRFTKIYSPTAKFIYSYDYDAKRQRFVVISKSGQDQHTIESIGLNGEVLSHAVIQINDHQTSKEYFNSVLHPSGDFVISYTSSGIRYIDFEGKIVEPHYDSLVDLLSPSFHPSGDKIVATHMMFDTDIGVIKVRHNQIDNSSLSIVSRSSAPEYNAKFQPTGNAIAFMSMRTGNRQLWINENNNEKQITRAQNGLLTFTFLWSPDGKNLALVENGALFVYGLTSNKQKISLPHQIDRITQWLDNGMIMYITNNQLYQTNLSGEVEQLMEGNSLKTAYMLDNGNIFYISDNTAIVNGLQTNTEITALSPLINAKRLIFKNNQLFGINGGDQLWQYNFTTESLNMLEPLKYKGVKLSDVKNDQILISYDVDVKMEIIEFDVINTSQ